MVMMTVVFTVMFAIIPIVAVVVNNVTLVVWHVLDSRGMDARGMRNMGHGIDGYRVPASVTATTKTATNATAVMPARRIRRRGGECGSKNKGARKTQRMYHNLTPPRALAGLGNMPKCPAWTGSHMRREMNRA